MGFFDEYIKKNFNIQDLEKELLELIKNYNDEKDSYLLVYTSAMDKPIPYIPLIMDDYYTIYDMLRNVKSKKLDFYIETPGGSGETAEELVRFLREKFEIVNFIISGEAKSAGTILVLSGDDIFMTKSGSLGPIDAQVKIGRSIISAYDYMDWLNKTRDIAEKEKKLNPLDATMVAQISPGEYNQVYHALKFAEDLVVEWLPKYKFKNWNITETKKIPVTLEMKKKRAKEIAEELTNHAKWRTHKRSIKIKDLEDIGLKIEMIDNNQKIADIVYKIQTVIRLIFSKSNIFKIFATVESKLFSSATPIANPNINIPKTTPDVIEIDVPCPKCGKKHKIYAKFNPNPQIDKEFILKGELPFPKNNKLKCDCGFENDLSGIRNEIESKIKKKIII